MSEQKIKLLKLDGATSSEFVFPASLLVEKPATQAMFDVVLAEGAAERQGTHSTLTKAEVRGGGKKPWMQKHTGRARQGSTRNPHWVGGGVAFGPKPTRNYKLDISRQITRLSFKSALSTRIADLYAMEDVNMPSVSTKALVDFVNTAEFTGQKVLFVIDPNNKNLFLSAQNLPKVSAKSWKQVSTRDVLNAGKIVIQQSAISELAKVVR